MELPRPLCLLLVLLTIVSGSQAYKFFVGGSAGWVPNPSENYNQWAGRNRFQINDTVVFKYKKGSDSVLEVNKEDYDKCNKTNPIKKFEDGDTEFKLDRSGPFYFISGKDQNCEKGHQKLNVVVLSPRGQSQTPPPPPPSPKSPSPSPSPKPSPKPSPSPVPSVSPSHPPSPSPAVSPVPTPSGHPPSPSPAVSPVPTPSGHPPSPSPAVSPVPASGPPAPSPATSPAPAGKSPTPSPASSPGPVGEPPAPSAPTPPSPAGKSPSPSPGSPPQSPGGEETAPPPSHAWAAGPSAFLVFLVTTAVGAVLLR